MQFQSPLSYPLLHGHVSTPSNLHILWAQQRLALDPALPDSEAHLGPNTMLLLSWLRGTEGVVSTHF